jgi:hypothetical protein
MRDNQRHADGPHASRQPGDDRSEVSRVRCPGECRAMPAKRTAKLKRAVNARPEMPKALGKILAGGKPSADSGAPLASLLDRWVETERLAADVPATDAGRAGRADRANVGLDASLARRHRSRTRARRAGCDRRRQMCHELADDAGRGARPTAGQIGGEGQDQSLGRRSRRGSPLVSTMSDEIEVRGPDHVLR